MSNAVRIHHFAKSGHAHRALVFAKLAGIAHEEVPVDLAGGEHKSPEFLAMNPNGQVPVLQDGDVTVSDSNAILVYLARTYAPDWMPSTPIDEANVQRWLTLAAGEVAFGSCAARLITVFGAPLDVDFADATATKAMQNWNTGWKVAIGWLAIARQSPMLRIIPIPPMRPRGTSRLTPTRMSAHGSPVSKPCPGFRPCQQPLLALRLNRGGAMTSEAPRHPGLSDLGL